MRVLVAYGSKAGGTTGIAEAVANRLSDAGLSVALSEAGSARGMEDFDAIVVGSSLYAGRWHSDSVRFVKRLVASGFRRPVWVFHSGPLGEDADEPQPLPKKVAALLSGLDVQTTETFGGYLDEHPSGMLAKAMARNVAGDYRDWDAIARWADEIAVGLGAVETA